MILASPSGNTSGNLDVSPEADANSAVRLQDITFGVDEHHVATITLNRPDALNAISGRMAAELAWAWQTVRDTDDIHAVVLRAAGDKAFCTGVDVKGDAGWFFRTNVWNTSTPAP